MSAGTLIFVVAGILSLVGAIATVAAQNPIRGAMGLLVTILGIALVFLKLEAQFLAAIQLIVYAGAVVVLFVFVIMLLGPDAGGAGPASAPPKARIARAFAGVLLAVMGGMSVVLLGLTRTEPTRFVPARPEHGSVEAVGGRIFSDGIVPFELATALLIVAVIGAIAVARGKQGAPKESPLGTGKFFSGPILPRDDRGRPSVKEPPATAPGHGGHG